MIVDKADYLDKMDNLINDTQKFKIINLKNDRILNFAVNQVKSVDNILRKLVATNSIPEETRRSLKPVGTRLDIIYGLCNIREDIIENCLPCLPLLPDINTPSYKLYRYKLLLPIKVSSTCFKIPN